MTIAGDMAAGEVAQPPRHAKPAGAACAACPARDAACVLPEPAKRAVRLAIVGEGPGHSELAEGRPFVGASGRMLMRGLRTIGIDRADVHWTNAVLCECAPGDLPAARKACQARLTAELDAVAAPVVVPLGAFGLQGTLAVNKKPQILKWRGSVNPRVTPSGPRLVCPTVHPAFVMRSPAWGPVLECDVARIGRVLDHGFTPPEADPRRKIVIARDYYGLQERLAQLSRGAIGFDVETVGLGPLTTSLVCFALSDGRLTIVVPWSRGANGLEPFWPSPARVAALVTAALRDRVSVTHNGPAFDFLVAERYGIRIARWEDTLLQAHAIDGHMPKRLQHVVTYTAGLDVHAWKEDDHAETIEKLWLYNARDTLYTTLAYHVMAQRLARAA